MTLVPNRPQPLSGNKFLLLLLVLIIGFSSCDAFRKAQTDDPVGEDGKDELPEIQGDTVYNPETGEYEHSTSVTESLDTVKWKVTPREDAPPITSEATTKTIENPVDPITTRPETGESEKLSSYNIAFLLPFGFQVSGDGSIDNRSLPAINFYGGAKMAFDRLSGEGKRFNVTVHDTKGSGQVTEDLMKTSAVQSAHLIVGPVRKNNVKMAAQFAKNMGIPLVSPLSPSSGVASNNPYFIQVNPYLRTHCEAIIKHARERYSSDQIVLAVRNKQAEIARLKYFQEANKEYEESEFAKRLSEFIITDETADYSEMDVAPYIKEGDTTVFIVPSWSNENFIYSLLRKIQVARMKNTVIVYGMPQWMKYDRISFDYYEQLNLHVSSGIFLDPDSDKVQNFKRDYFNRYGTSPSQEAFVGYDVMTYFGRMISKHGTKFQDRLDTENAEYLHTNFNFMREVPLSAILEEDYTQTNLFENKHVNILKFEDYYFQLAD